MPPATGFQYTPPSYLLRASDTTNRPWNKTEEGEARSDDAGFQGENEYDLPQEQRPQTRRESHLDAHFQQRVRNKQSRYRDILKGERDAEGSLGYGQGYGNSYSNSNSNPNSNSNSNPRSSASDDEDDSVLLAAANADSYADVHSARVHALQSRSNELARKNRKERITGVPDSSVSASRRSEASEAETARSLRAQRLRSSLLKPTAEEYDVQTKLEMRRFARKEEEAAARKLEREEAMALEKQQKQRELEEKQRKQHQKHQQKRAMEKERKTLEAEREALAIAKEEAALALMRAAELNEERLRQREMDAREEDRKPHRRDRLSAGSAEGRKHRKMRTKNYFSGSSTSDGETFMTEFDPQNDFAFLNDLSGIVRDTGLLKTCGACFGDTEDVLETPSMKPDGTSTKASSKISSVFVPDLVASSDNSASDDDRTGDSVHKSRVYARYRA